MKNFNIEKKFTYMNEDWKFNLTQYQWSQVNTAAFKVGIPWEVILYTSGFKTDVAKQMCSWVFFLYFLMHCFFDENLCAGLWIVILCTDDFQGNLWELFFVLRIAFHFLPRKKKYIKLNIMSLRNVYKIIR